MVLVLCLKGQVEFNQIKKAVSELQVEEEGKKKGGTGEKKIYYHQEKEFCESGTFLRK